MLLSIPLVHQRTCTHLSSQQEDFSQYGMNKNALSPTCKVNHIGLTESFVILTLHKRRATATLIALLLKQTTVKLNKTVQLLESRCPLFLSNRYKGRPMNLFGSMSFLLIVTVFYY